MRSFVLTTLLIACAVKPVLGQIVDPRTTPIPELLSRFVEQRSTPNGPQDASNAIEAIFRGYVSRPPSDIDALISGLDSIARDGPTSYVKATAVGALILAGSARADNAPRHPGVGPVVLAIFEEVEDPTVRGSTVMMLSQLADRSVAVRILRRVLTEEPPGYVIDRGDDARRAVAVALGVGPPGLALLRELHAAGTIRDSSARAMVEELRANGRLGGGGLE